MEKLLLFPGKSEKGIFTYVIDTEMTHLVKTAAEYHPEIANYIRSAQKMPGKTQILLTALGAGEWWGCNANGDFFPEAALSHFGQDFGYKTFEYNAKVYKHHINKDPTASYGDVPLAVYNPRYHRVELIIVIDNAKAPDIVEDMESGNYPEWSMGCRVPYDICNCCGNKARTMKEYCEHLKYYMGRIPPGYSKQAYAINYMPRFFDISKVLIGADKVAKTLRKVASAGGGIRPTISSAYIAEKMAESSKSAEIVKNIPASDPPASQEAIDTLTHSIPEVKANETKLPTPVLDSLGRHKLNDVMSTLAMLGILPKPQEFQRILLISIGKKGMADQLDHNNMCFDPVADAEPSHLKLMNVSADNFNPEIMRMLAPFMAGRSYMAPHLGPRIVMMAKMGSEITPDPLPIFIKLADRKPVGIIPLMALAAGLYAALSQKAGPEIVGSLDKLIATHPGLAAALAMSAPMIFNNVVGPRNVGQYDAAGEPQAENVSLAQRIDEMRQKPYTKTATLLGPATKRLFLGIPAAYMASGILQKQRQASPHEDEGRIRAFVRKYPDLIGAALAADAMAGSKGTHGLLSKTVPHAQGLFRKATKAFGKLAEEHPFLKTASAHDFISNSLIWPLAAGGANLPAKVVGGLFDQAVLEVSKKVLANKKQGTKVNT